MGERLEEFKQKLEKIDKTLFNAGVKVLGWEEVDGKDFEFSLDFSEHDKVFEDKIAEMKSEISILKSLVENYRASRKELISENNELKKRISELENENKNLNIRIFQNEIERDKKENMVCVKVLVTPMEIATCLIENTCTINELEIIAEHLLVYCKHKKRNE